MSRRHARLDPALWAATRRAAFRRDGWRCTECGRAGRLEAHHEPPLRDGMDPYDLAGVKTLCRTCHIERHRPDAMTPGRAEWAEYVKALAERG
ncbi:MAG: hypothetical protein F4160_11220 [Rhodospirillaceae bacterium]|nr:hypothetical protein [Rhodospirillaceae bacterium]